MRAILKINCSSIRKRLEEANIKLCICCGFENAVWLVANKGDLKVHGEGYPFEELDIYKVEEVLKISEKNSSYIDYNIDVEGFIKFCKENLNNI